MKRILMLLCCAVFIFVCSIVVYAHPGRTDSNGGHTDSSTGEYHYHHGYSAHDHYDMDGDGVIDCPYDFDDKTGESSGSGNNNSSRIYQDDQSKSNGIYRNDTTEPVAAITTPVNTEREAKTVPEWVYWIMAILAITTVFLFATNKQKSEEIGSLNNKLADEKAKNKRIVDAQAKESNQRYCATPFIKEIHDLESKNTSLQMQLDSAQKSLEQEKHKAEKLKSENGQLQSRISELSIELDKLDKKESTLSVQAIPTLPIPDGIYFINGNVPVKGIISDRRPFGDYTVYIAKRGKCYHADPYCGSGLLDAVHLFDVVNRKPPCQKCVFGQIAPLPEQYDQLNFLTPGSY